MARQRQIRHCERCGVQVLKRKQPNRPLYCVECAVTRIATWNRAQHMAGQSYREQRRAAKLQQGSMGT